MPNIRNQKFASVEFHNFKKILIIQIRTIFPSTLSLQISN